MVAVPNILFPQVSLVAIRVKVFQTFDSTIKEIIFIKNQN